jgi:hypothetical protein
VGAFSCDIFAVDTRSKRKVIIENQLEATDHTHLGQLMAYAAGLEADVICWISPDFRDEHTLAISWLNNHTTDDVQFLAVRLRALQINDSLPAPLFEIVASPNAFQRETKKQEELSELAKFYQDFWSEFLSQARNSKLYSGTQKASSENWLGLPSGLGGFSYNLVFAKGNIFRVELYIDHGTGTKDLNELIYEELLSEKERIEQELNEPLLWQKLEHATACRIALDRQYSDRNADREALLIWGAEKLAVMKGVFNSRIRKLRGK